MTIFGHSACFENIFLKLARRTPDELQACFKLLKDASKTLAQEFNTVIIVKSVNRTEENR